MEYTAITKESYIDTLKDLLSTLHITNILSGERGLNMLNDNTEFDMSKCIHMPTFDNREFTSEVIEMYPATSYTMHFMQVDKIVAILRLTKNK